MACETEPEGAVPRERLVTVCVLVAVVLEANLNRHSLQRGFEFLVDLAQSTNGADFGSQRGRGCLEVSGAALGKSSSGVDGDRVAGFVPALTSVRTPVAPQFLRAALKLNLCALSAGHAAEVMEEDRRIGTLGNDS